MKLGCCCRLLDDDDDDGDNDEAAAPPSSAQLTTLPLLLLRGTACVYLSSSMSALKESFLWPASSPSPSTFLVPFRRVGFWEEGWDGGGSRCVGGGRVGFRTQARFWRSGTPPKRARWREVMVGIIVVVVVEGGVGGVVCSLCCMWELMMDWS